LIDGRGVLALNARAPSKRALTTNWVETMARFGSHVAMSVGCVLAALTAVSSASAANFAGDPAATCGGLAGAAANAVQIDSATMQVASPLAVSARAPTPAAR